MNTIIEKLKAIIRLQIKRENLNFAALGGGGQTWNIETLEWVLKRLSDLEKEEKPMELDFEQELYKHFGQVKDFTLGMRIGQYFYELGCRRTAEKYDEIEYKRQRADVCEDLETEIERYLSTEWELDEDLDKDDYIYGCTLEDLKILARHFAKWGAEHAKK